MPFAIYESNDEKKFKLFSANANLLGEVGLITLCSESAMKKKGIFIANRDVKEYYEVKGHFDQKLIHDVMMHNYIGIRSTPYFLIQSSNSKDSDVFSVSDIFLYSSYKIKGIDDGWITFMLGLDHVGYTNSKGIVQSPPRIIPKNKWQKCYTINYFTGASIRKNNKMHGKWAPSGPYKSNFLWKNMGEFIKNNINY